MPFDFSGVKWGDVPANEGDAPQRLEPGGYVAKTVNVTDVTDNTGSYLNVEFDIAKGPFEGYYRKRYEQYGDWNGKFRLYYKYTAKKGSRAGQAVEDYSRIKGWLVALEKSNGIQLHYDRVDEKMFRAFADKGCLFGVLMGYDAKQHKYLNVYQVRSVDVIDSGAYEIPEAWKVHNSGNAGQYGGNGGGQSAPPPPEADDEDLPF